MGKDGWRASCAGPSPRLTLPAKSIYARSLQPFLATFTRLSQRRVEPSNRGHARRGTSERKRLLHRLAKLIAIHANDLVRLGSLGAEMIAPANYAIYGQFTDVRQKPARVPSGWFMPSRTVSGLAMHG
jgi:hypothetical protein